MFDPAHQQPSPEQKRSHEAPQAGRKPYRLLLFSFGLLCAAQAALNVSLRLSVDSNPESTCNRSQVQDGEQRTPSPCNALQERLNALAGENSLLQDQISELNNRIRNSKNQIRVLEQREIQPCPPKWVDVRGRCYYVSSGNKSWQLSRRFCQRNGADLVVINGTDEQIHLYTLKGTIDRFWIGLKNSAETFRWVDGSVPVEVFWQEGQPDSGGPYDREDCVVLDQNQNTVLANWKSAPCGQRNRWLCEKEPRVKPIN